MTGGSTKSKHSISNKNKSRLVGSSSRETGRSRSREVFSVSKRVVQRRAADEYYMVEDDMIDDDVFIDVLLQIHFLQLLFNFLTYCFN